MYFIPDATPFPAIFPITRSLAGWRWAAKPTPTAAATSGFFLALGAGILYYSGTITRLLNAEHHATLQIAAKG